MPTPADRHAGNCQRIDIARQAGLDAAHKAHPERFPNVRPHPPARVWINPNELHTTDNSTEDQPVLTQAVPNPGPHPQPGWRSTTGADYWSAVI
jgi:hypothetical protein